MSTNLCSGEQMTLQYGLSLWISAHREEETCQYQAGLNVSTRRQGFAGKTATCAGGCLCLCGLVQHGPGQAQ